MSKKTPEKTMSIETRIYLVQDHGKLLARATVTLGGCFAITGIQIMEGKEDQPFVSMPSWKVGEKYKDICFPCTKEARAALHEAVLNAYEQALHQNQGMQAASQDASQENQAAPQMTM